MRFQDLVPIELNVIETSTVYQAGKPRPKQHDWQIDWERLRQLILDNDERIDEVKAGIAEDWVRTHGTVWDRFRGFYRRPNDSYDYDDTVFWGYSSWGTPAIAVIFADETEASYQLYKEGMDYNFHYLGK
ncbi:hypothetical protein [Secundilactobacillus mixtipabuli]|jgi:hypothetical protein|uniref:Uncharacterized protein n=1 Tax=Secundilactobacillus mixtipabuli TaxID=1435342 RepID=A0A1Z5ICF1_9LACO|nr:hypothetical protein [Secundilactobacillus mixtipabuli]GAW99453.1 hypothetical protein IWT30_01423 [Secundilactobacillus mixtipabuli]